MNPLETIDLHDSDPFMDRDYCLERLMAEYRTHGKLIVAVDFDDTVFDFHKVGRRYDRVLDLLRRCQALDFYIVLFTGTPPSQWDDQRQYLANRGIHIEVGINENPIKLPFGNWGKPYWNILLDDRAGLGQAYAILSSVVSQIELERGN